MTERTRRRARSATTARTALTPLEWRLGLVTALGVVYLAAASSLSSDLPPSTADWHDETTTARGRRATEDGARSVAPKTVWFDRMPSAARPSLAIPPGYRLASSDASLAPSTSTVVARADRVARRRPIRIRTRSS